jgi:hypothetical protein
MKQKAFVLQNKGMNRDTSISKVGESSAYENHNIRILARDHDTLLSVTNERGNKEVPLNVIIKPEEVLIGWNVLNEYIILFTHEDPSVDRIYRIEYDKAKSPDFSAVVLFRGNLNLSTENPIESVVYHETDEIQKIYWVDGKNVLRFMNFVAEPVNGLYPWQISANVYDETYFDSNRIAKFDVGVEISKDNSGNTRANGVVQYLLTYYNKHGQESGYVWISDLVYLSPVASGGAADGTNNNSVMLSISNLDQRFSYFRVYSVFRSALNGTTVAYIVFDGKTDGGSATVVDNNSHLTAVDSSKLLYLGSQHVVANTLAHKDQTLFLGNLSSVDRDYDAVESVLKQYMFDHNVEDGKTPWECAYIEFVYDTDNKIPNETGGGNYSYNSQLVYSSSEITSFKGGEKYRFALTFHKKDGTMTDAFWIGDKVNPLYPEMTDDSITRIIAKCTLPVEVVRMMRTKEYSTAQLMIAEATYADRAIKAQGIVCPTVFNVWNRYMNRLYSASSWMMRPRNSEYAWKHFEPIHNSTSSTGEIDCNYWETENSPHPYYVFEDYASDKKYKEDFDGLNEYDYAMIIYRIWCDTTLAPNRYFVGATVILAKALDGSFPLNYEFSDRILYSLNALISDNDEQKLIFTDSSASLRVLVHNLKSWHNDKPLDVNLRKESAYTHIVEEIHKNYEFFDVNELVSLSTFRNTWCSVAADTGNTNKWWFFNNSLSSSSYTSIENAVSDNGGNSITRWYPLGEESAFGDGDNYAPSYYKKHLEFIDENVITLNSPEIEYEAVSFDQVNKYRFRIVGVAAINSNYSDYVVDATPGKYAGENLVREQLGNTLISWPLWKENTLDEKWFEDDDSDKPRDVEEDPRFRDSYDYKWGGGYARYWLHMWNHSGKIIGFTDIENNDYSRLIRKVFANSRYSNKTCYDVYKNSHRWSVEPDSIRIFNYTSSQYVGIKIDSDTKYYDGILNDSLSLPGEHKYPVLKSLGIPDPTKAIKITDDSDLYLADPVSITYSSTPHVVISLPTEIKPDGGKNYYQQTILPRILDREIVSVATASESDTGALIPWIDNKATTSYPYKDYSVVQDELDIPDGTLSGDSPKYLYIGEIYFPINDDDEIRYGGTTDAAIQNNRFLVAGPQYLISDMVGDGSDVMIANQADTYIQRWDCLKTKPYSTGAVNNVIDITSVMLETHINIDGRTDLQRGTSYIASIDAEKFGQLNPVYSQHNNFITQRDLDEDFNLDSYRSSITWTMEKHDSEDVDEWTHITLASSLKLDGDKGECQALRRFNNTIIAFQDHAISEILFNSRTQLTTADGVPVEIANSGKVDGKRYITNNYGCTNKWSIVEGKSALYFVDNINKAFCAFGGQGIQPLSDTLGFSTWFKRNNTLESWNPVRFNNIVSFYDRIHSDVYLVKRNDSENQPCLVYNEALGAFTSFFDYCKVPMMVNVKDRFVSFRDGHLWKQNEGLYGNFFGYQYGFWTWYRVTPDPYLDKIWTNIDYRADFYQVLDDYGTAVVPEEELINGDRSGEIVDQYKEWETFTDYRVWNEYQTTGYVPFTHEKFDRDDVRKKFRIWRLAIPRAIKEGTNRHGMDRIRNPWINILFRKENQDGRNLMQLHDIVVKYFE